MSMRRSRIKPAINLAASRRSSASSSKTPSGPASKSSPVVSRSNQRTKPAVERVLGKTAAKKEPSRNQKPGLQRKSPEEKTKSVELNSSTIGKSSEADGVLKEITSKSVLERESLLVQRTFVQNRDGGEKRDDESLVNAVQDSLPIEIVDSSTTPEDALNKSTNPVRRKRITAVPNFSQRRAPVPASKCSIIPKSRQTSTNKESEVLSEPTTLTDQKEKRKNSTSCAEVANGEPSDNTKENDKSVEPPVVQRRILSQAALSATQQHGDPEDSRDLATQKIIARDKTQDAVTKKTPIVDLTTDKATNGPPSATCEVPKEGVYSGNIYRKRLEEMNAFKKEVAPSNKRKRLIQRPKNGIDTSKMRMKDLIYFNPKGNKMRPRGDDEVDKSATMPKQVNDIPTPIRGEEETNMEDEQDASVAAAPQVKIGPDGNIILDKQSLVKMVTPKRKMNESEITEVKEDSSTTTYSSFRKSKHSAAWSVNETEKFYNALSTVGTDFSMINAIFPNRKRRELKNKFKREERRNGVLVENALRDTRPFDFTDFQNMEEENNVDESVLKSNKKRKKKHEGPEDNYVAPKSRKSDIDPIEIVEENLPSPTQTELPTAILPEKENSQQDLLESLQNPFGAKHILTNIEDRKSSGDEEEYDMDSILGKPTRSGRQPKQREVFTIKDALSQPRNRTKAEKVNAHSKGKSKKMKHRKKKKHRLDRHTTHDVNHIPVAAMGVDHSPETLGLRVPPLHPEIEQSENTPDHSFGTEKSLQLPSRKDGQRPEDSPSFRTEHYLVTYPDGSKTLIQMPVPIENDKSFEFVLNLLPSPYREGSTLQLGIVPKDSNFSPRTPVQSLELEGGVKFPVSTPGHGIPVNNMVTPVSAAGNLHSAVESSSHLRYERSAMMSLPGTSSSFNPELLYSEQNNLTSSMLHSVPLGRTPVSSTSQIGPSSSPSMSHGKGYSGTTPVSGNTYSPLLTSGSMGSLQDTALSKSFSRPLLRVITPKLSLANSIYHSSSTTGLSVPDRMSTKSGNSRFHTGVSHGSTTSCQLSLANAISTFRSGFAQITNNFELGSRPPIQILSTQSKANQDMLLSQDIIRTSSNEVQSSSFALAGSSNISIRMHNSPGKGINEQRIYEDTVTSNTQLEASDNQVTDNSNIETEVVYMSGLVDPLTGGSEISDPIIAQHVDVCSSVQHDEIQATENEAFIPL